MLNLNRVIIWSTNTIAIAGLAILSASTHVSAAPPDPQPGCPDGWVPRPQGVNPALGPCMPGNIQQGGGGNGTIQLALPDLNIQQLQFVPTANQTLRVRVVNQGNANAPANVLRLTVRRINGTPVGRTMDVPLPAINQNQAKWVLVNAKEVLPTNVALKDTTFRLNVDVTSIVNEGNESNNETWHNL